MLVCEIWSMVQTNQGSAVLLKPRNLDIAVPIFIGALEMQSILIGKEGVSLPRPLTHDLFLDMLSRVNLAIKKVEVYELKDNTFHARLVITGGEYTNEKPLVIDSRPSDALALAVRRHYTILISSAVVEKAGIPLDFFIEALEKDSEAPLDDKPQDKDSKHQSLLKQLEQAVAEEEYERAAEIRDLLKQIDSESEGSILL